MKAMNTVHYALWPFVCERVFVRMGTRRRNSQQWKQMCWTTGSASDHSMNAEEKKNKQKIRTSGNRYFYFSYNVRLLYSLVRFGCASRVIDDSYTCTHMRQSLSLSLSVSLSVCSTIRIRSNFTCGRTRTYFYLHFCSIRGWLGIHRLRLHAKKLFVLVVYAFFLRWSSSVMPRPVLGVSVVQFSCSSITYNTHTRTENYRSCRHRRIVPTPFFSDFLCTTTHSTQTYATSLEHNGVSRPNGIYVWIRTQKKGTKNYTKTTQNGEKTSRKWNENSPCFVRCVCVCGASKRHGAWMNPIEYPIHTLTRVSNSTLYTKSRIPQHMLFDPSKQQYKIAHRNSEKKTKKYLFMRFWHGVFTVHVL